MPDAGESPHAVRYEILKPIYHHSLCGLACKEKRKLLSKGDKAFRGSMLKTGNVSLPCTQAKETVSIPITGSTKVIGSVRG
jgi:hypothetical protein